MEHRLREAKGPPRGNTPHSDSHGSATITSWPSSSRQRATHSLSVDASISIRALGRAPKTSPRRTRSVTIRSSIRSPLSVRMQP
jgi:hypothetical protein